MYIYMWVKMLTLIFFFTLSSSPSSFSLVNNLLSCFKIQIYLNSKLNKRVHSQH